MARYRKVETAMTSDERIRRLSRPQPNGQSVWFYLLTGERTTSIPGVVVAREAVMADDLRWPIEGFREAFGEALREGLAKVDREAGLVYLPKALLTSAGTPREVNRPESPNVVRAWGKSWPDVPECPLKSEIYRDLASFCEALGEAFAKAFREAFGHPSPNQEQEQEQKEGEKAPPRSLDRLDEIRLAIWQALHDARGRAIAAGCPKTMGPGPAPAGELGKALTARLQEAIAGGDNYAAALARGMLAVACAEAKAKRDRNLRHFATAFEPTDWSRAMESDPSALEGSQPSALAQGEAAKRRAAERQPAKPAIHTSPPRLKTYIPPPAPDPATVVSAEEMREAFAAARRSG